MRATLTKRLIPLLDDLRSIFTEIAVGITDQHDLIASIDCSHTGCPHTAVRDQAADEHNTHTSLLQFTFQAGFDEGIPAGFMDEDFIDERLYFGVQLPGIRTFDQQFLIRMLNEYDGDILLASALDQRVEVLQEFSAW